MQILAEGVEVVVNPVEVLSRLEEILCLSSIPRERCQAFAEYCHERVVAVGELIIESLVKLDRMVLAGTFFGITSGSLLLDLYEKLAPSAK